MSEYLGVILAGGLARRMGGGDKTLLTVGDDTLLQHCINRLAPQVEGMIINANGDPTRFAEYNIPIVADSITDEKTTFAGPLAGVLAGMEWVRENEPDVKYIVTVAGDTPFFPSDLVNVMQKKLSEQTPLVCAATNGRGHPVFGLWPVALADDLRDALRAGTRKVLAWTEPHGLAFAEFPSQPLDPFFNLNKPEDLITAKEYL